MRGKEGDKMETGDKRVEMEDTDRDITADMQTSGKGAEEVWDVSVIKAMKTK